MNGITVRELLKACQQQVAIGNGDKIVLLSSDDEGNEFHTLWCGFTYGKENMEALQDLFHDNNDPKDVVILG